MNIRELAYIVLDTVDLPRWRSYFTDVVGAMVADGPEGALRVRLDERDCRLLLRPADTEKLGALGWLVRDQEAYQQAMDAAQAAGQPLIAGTEAQCIARRVNGFFELTDPAGHRHEISWGPVVNFRERFHSPAGVPAFSTGDEGLGHLVIGCEPQQFEASSRFLVQVLGLKVANLRSQSLSEGPLKFPITWFHAGNPRQHSIGVAASFAPGVPRHGCRHINVEATDIDEVGRALDRAERHGARIVRTLGRHVNDRAISFYMQSPGGFLIEYGACAPKKDWSSEVVFDEGGVGSLWGHKPIAER